MTEKEKPLCPKCPHPMADHFKDKDKTHAHFRDSMRMMGHGSRMIPNTNPNAYCHVALCTCGVDGED